MNIKPSLGVWTKYATQPDIISKFELGNLFTYIGTVPTLTLIKYVELLCRIKFDMTVSSSRYYRLRPYLLRRIVRQYGTPL